MATDLVEIRRYGRFAFLAHRFKSFTIAEQVLNLAVVLLQLSHQLITSLVIKSERDTFHLEF